jgi:hypothetical protein
MLNHGNTLVQLLHCLSLSSSQLESAFPPALVSVAILTGRLVGHHLALSNVLERISRPCCEPLYEISTSHCKQEIFLLSSIAHKRTHKRTLLFGNALLNHGRQYGYWNQRTNMRVCYLDCHKARLCCYLVIHTGNLLRPLELFYFHLWPIYCLSLVLLANVKMDPF